MRIDHAIEASLGANNNSAILWRFECKNRYSAFGHRLLRRVAQFVNPVL